MRSECNVMEQSVKQTPKASRCQFLALELLKYALQLIVVCCVGIVSAQKCTLLVLDVCPLQ
jgi:hypothetical protein